MSAKMIFNIVLFILWVGWVIVPPLLTNKSKKKTNRGSQTPTYTPPPMPTNPMEPLEQGPDETTAEFIDRLQERIRTGYITPNAARLSVGLAPIKRDGDGITCATCRSRAVPDGACSTCKRFNRWRPRR